MFIKRLQFKRFYSNHGFGFKSVFGEGKYDKIMFIFVIRLFYFEICLWNKKIYNKLKNKE